MTRDSFYGLLTALEPIENAFERYMSAEHPSIYDAVLVFSEGYLQAKYTESSCSCCSAENKTLPISYEVLKFYLEYEDA